MLAAAWSCGPTISSARDLEQEPRRDAHPAAAPGRPPPGVGQEQPPLRAGDARRTRAGAPPPAPSRRRAPGCAGTRPPRGRAMNTTGNSRPFAAWSVISVTASVSPSYAVLVGDQRRLLEQPVERVLRRQVVVAGGDRPQLEQVRPAVLALLGAVGEHRAVARLLEDLVEQLGERQHADPRPEPRAPARRTPPIAVRSRGASPSTSPLRPRPRSPAHIVSSCCDGVPAERLDALVADRRAPGR